MSGKYSVEDLLKLRASPLICKPANLPAIQDVLSTPDTATKRPPTRGKLDDSNTQTEGFPKRPLLDGQQRKSTTDPDRIILGPPRRSFASSNARTTGKGSQESPDETSNSYKGSAFERFRNGDGSDRKSNQSNGRYSAVNDQDPADGRTRQKVDEDDDSRPKREHERKPKWAAGDEEQSHRNKFEQPWFRRDRGGDLPDDARREGNKHQDWRRDRGKDRGWDRPAPPEEDPEWMDEPVEEPAAPARTQEDFQRWKERMKAGKGVTTSKDEAVLTPSSPEPASSKSQKAAQPFVDAEADDSMDKFFARFNEAKITAEPPITIKAPTKTRFASLFSPLAEQPPQELPTPQSQTQAHEMFSRENLSQTPDDMPSADADQAGFARILEMLQGRSQNTAASQPQEPKQRVPLYARDSQPKPETEKLPPPRLVALSHPRPPTAENQPLHSQDRIQEARSPTDQGHARQQSNKDELLLNLLRQANQAPKPTPVSLLHDQYSGRGMYSNEDALNRSAIARNQLISPHQQLDHSFMSRRENGRTMFEDPTQPSMRYHEDPSSHEHLTRRPTNEAPRPAYDDHMVNFLRGQAMNQQQKPIQQTQQQQPQPQAPPPGLARPPGLDQMARPPPGWPTQQPQLPQRQTAPPPGMPNLLRNIPTSFGGPNLGGPQPQPNQRPPQPQPPPQQRKYTGGESGMPGFPPMGPPPGFMNNGPPPGFPGVGGQGYGRYQGPPEPPQALGRAFMDMYGDVGRAGVRGNTGGGAAGGMPGYR